MRTFKTLLIIILFCSCGDSGNTEELNQLQLAVEQFESERAEEEENQKICRDLCRSDECI